MVKLIVDESGKRRAFRMGKGVLTVGSGAEARLKLASPQVAEVHFELSLSEKGVALRPRPGVVAPKVAGRPAQGEVLLALGQKIEIGNARLWLEAEEGEDLPVSAPAPAAGARVQRAQGTGATGVKRARRSPKEERPGRIPGWLVPVGILALVGVVFMLWFREVKSSATLGAGMATNKLRAAEQAAASADFESALRELSEIPLESLTPDLEERKKALEKRLKEGQDEVALRLANQSGNKYLDTMLKKYEGLYLQGTPEQAKVRLFLKRCRTFRERWPQHPEADWAKRQEARFAGYVDMNAPPTWEDVEWEVKYMTEGNPRNYVAAFALIDELLTRVSGEERTKAQNRRDELVAGRPEYAKDRLYQAQYEFEKKENPQLAVWWLVNNVAYLGDEALANESARFLEKMPELAGHLLAYKQDYPERYAAVMKNAVIALWAEEAGFTP